MVIDVNMPDLQVITLKVRLVYIMVLIFVDRWSKMVTDKIGDW